MSETLLSLQSISASMAGREILKSVSMEVRLGEFFSLLGPSGCGKTTLLRIIAGFLQPNQGKLLWCGSDATHLPPQRRDLNLVFQNYALFPHLNVFENVAFGLRMQKLPEDLVVSRVAEALSLVRMNQHARRRVTELSGGQQQRVALARAVAPRPKLVLLDEPLGALDLQLRKEMQWELKTLQRQLGMTFLYVTHDQEEAFAMSDRIAILNAGRLEQVASPEELYSRPASRFVAQFIGTANFIPAEKTSLDHARCLNSNHHFLLHETNAEELPENYPINGDILVRPEQIILKKKQTEELKSLSGVIQMRQFLGATVRYHAELQGNYKRTLTIDQSSAGHEPIAVGEHVSMLIINPSSSFFTESRLA
jgi:spermidine/putrescine ABC transporter ATP-binding subunit